MIRPMVKIKSPVCLSLKPPLACLGGDLKSGVSVADLILIMGLTFRDIGLIGDAKGWIIVIGGNVGTSPRLAQKVAEGLDTEQAVTVLLSITKKMPKKGSAWEK